MGLHKQAVLNLSKTLRKFNIENQLEKIQVPSLIVVGSKDKPNKPAAQELAKLIKQSSYNEIEGAGHELNKTHVQEFAHLIQEFSNLIK